MEFKTLRQKIGTQEEAAAFFHVSQAAISSWEVGTSMPKTTDLMRLPSRNASTRIRTDANNTTAWERSGLR